MAIEALKGKPWYVGLSIGVGVGLALGALVWWQVYEPKKKEIARHDKKLSELHAKIQEGRAAKARLPEFREEVRRLELELEKLLRILPTRLNTEDLLRRLRAVAEQGGLDIIQIRPGRLQDRDFYRIWPITIQINARYHTLAQFFDRVGRFSRIINVDNVQIRPLGRRGRGGGRTISASFVSKTFVYKPQRPPAAGKGKGKGKGKGRRRR